MTDLPDLPPVSNEDMRAAGLPALMEMSPALAIYFSDAMYNRCKQIAVLMANAEGFTPKHLLHRGEACFMVISRAIVWKLDPSAVAMSTYQTPGGAIGFEGKLVQAILENSGQIIGGVKYTLTGDWAKVRGKFTWEKSSTGKNNKPVQAWTDEDEAGLGVKVSAQVKGEATPREEEFALATFWPRNSTLWVLRPEQQIKYAACRAFANTVMPGILMGIAFDIDPMALAEMQDITPPDRPQLSEFARAPERDMAELGEWTAKVNFANSVGDVAKLREEGLAALPKEAHPRFEETCDNRSRQIAGQEMPERGALAPPADDGKEPAKVDEGEKDPALEAMAKLTPFQHGMNMLSTIKELRDVPEAFSTFLPDMKKKKDKDLWRGSCEAKWKELGGTGPMPLGGLV